MKLQYAATTALIAGAWIVPACSPARSSTGYELGGEIRIPDDGPEKGGQSGASDPGAAGANTVQAGTGTAGASGSASGASGTSANVGGTSSGSAGTSGVASSGGSSAGSAAANTGGSSGTSAGSGGSGSPIFHAFLLLGQSNMAGYPKAQAADKIKNERIKVLGFDACAATGRVQDKWDVAVAPLHECWNGALGPGDYFAKTLIDVVPAGDSIGLVPCAVSGEKIETFLKSGGSKYSWIIARAKLAQQAGAVIEGMLFHQGESNCGDAAWPGKVNTLVTDLRKDLNLGNVPFLAGELAPTGACSQHNTQVAKLPSVVSNAFVVSAAGLVLDPADTQYHLHFDHDSQVTFGKRYEAAMVNALHW
ncbi:MAG TPA: sialate O-acetylesterase [Polyangiaceae bacterium]|nr:sialate O-acetylesterase [Polyangiaceae bacterium]